MKRSFYSAIALFLVVGTLNYSCKKKDKDPEPEEPKEPLACFNMSSRYFPNAGLVTNFTNCSENFERSEWNFGDGGTSTLQEPSHKWENNGIYDVQLTVFNESSKNSKVTKKVYIGQKGYINCKIKIIAWKDTSGSNFSGFAWGIRTFRASDNSTTGANYYSFPRQYAAGLTVDQGSLTINEDTKLNVELYVSGGAGGKVVISDVNIIDGVQNPMGTANLPVCDFSYTLSAYTSP